MTAAQLGQLLKSARRARKLSHTKLLAQTPQVITQVSSMLPKGFSQQGADTVLGGLAQAAKALEAVPAH
jgi:hypothetical protein